MNGQPNTKAPTAGGDYFEEKAHQVSTASLSAFGIDLMSRYAKAQELIELLQFAQAVAGFKLHHLVKAAFYDSKACVCSFTFSEELVEYSTDADLILEAALETVSQFDWFGCIKHGGLIRDLDS